MTPRLKKINDIRLACLIAATVFLFGCIENETGAPDTPTLLLAHDKEGNVLEGSNQKIVDAIRQGCDLRVGWGARRRADPTRTIEHSAEPKWINLSDGKNVEIQIGGFLTNLSVLGEPPEDHPRREQFGGTERVVKWRASLRTDGTFDAVWYYPHSGEFIKRVPQQMPMRWYANCDLRPTTPLFPES